MREASSWSKPCEDTLVARSQPRSAAEAQKLPLGVRWRECGATFVRVRGLTIPAQSREKVGPCGVKRVVVVQRQRVDQGQPGSRALHLSDGDRAIQRHDGGRRDREQLVVEGDDLRPVGLLDVKATACTALIAAWS